MPKFACSGCGSPAFTLQGIPTDDAAVHCADCGVCLGSWLSVRRRLKARLARKQQARPRKPASRVEIAPAL